MKKGLSLNYYCGLFLIELLVDLKAGSLIMTSICFGFHLVGSLTFLGTGPSLEEVCFAVANKVKTRASHFLNLPSLY